MTGLESQTLATTLYVSLFGRAPDKGGLAYWSQQLQGGLSLQDTIGYFLSSEEGKALYGSNPSAPSFVDNLYLNALNRTNDAGGSAFWQERLVELGSRNEMVEQFITAIQVGTGTDNQLLKNKVDFGLSFAASKSGDSTLYAKILLANVSSDPASLSLAKLVNEYVDNPPAPAPVIPPAAAPTLALHVDTGSFSGDGITMDDAIVVTMPNDVQSWSYSIDGGLNWNVGSGTSFTLLEGTYAAGTVQARYVDADGVQSLVASTASEWVIDQTGPVFKGFTQSVTLEAGSTTNDVTRVSVEFDEAVSLENAQNIPFFLDGGTTASVAFINNGLLDGLLTLDAAFPLGNRLTNIVLPAGMVLDAAGNPSHALAFNDNVTFYSL